MEKIFNFIGIKAKPTVINKCLLLALPINNSSKQLAPKSNAVDKLAGAINKQVTATGQMTIKYPLLKSLIISCRLLSNRAKYMNKASCARSDV